MHTRTLIHNNQRALKLAGICTLYRRLSVLQFGQPDVVARSVVY